MNPSKLRYETRLHLAKDPAADAKLLGWLAYDSDSVVRSAVAEHPNTSPLHLAKLASDEDCSVLFRVAANPKTPPDVLALMAEDMHDLWSNPCADVYWFVNFNLAGNPSTPPRAFNDFWANFPKVKTPDFGSEAKKVWAMRGAFNSRLRALAGVS